MQDKYLSIIHLNNYHSKKLINLFKILILFKLDADCKIFIKGFSRSKTSSTM